MSPVDYLGVPTHGDYAAVRPGHSRPSWRVPTAAAVVAVLAIGGIERFTTDVIAPGSVAYGPTVGATPASDRAPAGGGAAITTLRSRLVGRATIEIWGRTTATDGASIRLRVEPVGDSPITLPDVPAVDGRFYAKARVPERIRGGEVNVRAGIRQ